MVFSNKVNEKLGRQPVVGVLLHGSGAKDGSEIHEATLTLLCLEQAGAKTLCMAPDLPQRRTVDHLSGKDTPERRSMLIEAARIARGNIKKINEVRVDDLDAIVIPGGFGTVYNLCNFAEKGVDMDVIPEVSQLIKLMHTNKKPIGVVCIAPVIVAKVLGKFKPQLTFGHDEDVGSKAAAWGAQPVPADPRTCVIDEKNKIVSTPAYMVAESIAPLYEGISKLSEALLRLI